MTGDEGDRERRIEAMGDRAAFLILLFAQVILPKWRGILND